MKHSAVNERIIRELTKILDEKSIITDREKMIDYSHDEYSQHDIRRFPAVVVKPASTAEVSAIVKLANENKVPVTMRGGGTGLCGGCVPSEGGILISSEKLNKVVEIDKNNLMAVVEPGLSLMDFYKAIEERGLFFPPHPGAENATMGGVIATNAGGARAVKYGVIRNFVRGLEVVLADGEVITLGGKLIKSSSGYSLLNLMIGSEGTLGITTKAVISLCPPPASMYTLVVPFEDLEKAVQAVPEIIQNKILPMAVEFVEQDSIEVVEDFLNKKWPTHTGKASLMFIVDGSSEEEVIALSEKVGEICLQKGALDVLVADTREKQQTILELRSQIYEAMRNNMLEILDVTVPRSEIAKFVSGIHRIGDELEIWLPTYGHAADGNVHTNIMKATWKAGVWTEIPGWKEKYPQARKRIHDLGRQFKGIVSGEHGIGIVKKEYLGMFLDKRQIGLMKEIKRIFDPNNIMNPQKIFDME
jgi:glycolate oxidase